MIHEEDFIEDDIDQIDERAIGQIHVQYFIQSVKLAKITGDVLSKHYMVAFNPMGERATDIVQGDKALSEWLIDCPTVIQWSQEQHDFWAALLYLKYQ
jgi:hypothetical protein